MSRRPLLHPVGRLAKAQQRMAPGGLLWSESPIPRRYTPRVPMVGDDAPPPAPSLLWEFDGDLTNAGSFAALGAGDLIPGAGVGAEVFSGGCLKFWQNDAGPDYQSLAMDRLPAEAVTVANTVRMEIAFTTITNEFAGQADSDFHAVLAYSPPTGGTTLATVSRVYLPSAGFSDPVPAFGSTDGSEPGVPSATTLGWWDPAELRDYLITLDTDTATGEVVCTLDGATTTHPPTAPNTGPMPAHETGFVDFAITATNLWLCRVSITGVVLREGIVP